MADKTIAYSNSGGFWKTRYTFVSSCYAFVDRCLISFNKAFTSAPVWKHDDNGVARTNFYNGGTDGSGIAVTFNENPSQNKLYKAFSLESTNNVAGLNIFTVNNSSNLTQRKEIEVGVLEDRGGIMYGHIGRETVASGANVKLVGRIVSQSLNDQDEAVGYVMQFAEGGKSNLFNYPGNLTKFFIYNASTGAYFTNDLDATTPTPPLTYAGLAANLTLSNTEQGADGFANTTENSIFLNGDLIDPLDDEGNPIAGPFFLYSISPEAINAEDPKGQTADAVILLGSAEYELYALNVEYSPTDLDHSK